MLWLRAAKTDRVHSAASDCSLHEAGLDVHVCLKGRTLPGALVQGDSGQDSSNRWSWVHHVVQRLSKFVEAWRRAVMQR